MLYSIKNRKKKHRQLYKTNRRKRRDNKLGGDNKQRQLNISRHVNSDNSDSVAKRILAQSATNLVDKVGTSIVKGMGVDLNEPVDETMERITNTLQSGVDVLKKPEVKNVIQEGLVELVDDAKPAINKLASDGVSLVANVAEDLAGPLIGIPRTVGNVASIAETGIGLAQKTLGTMSNISNEIANASDAVSNSVGNVQQSVSDLKQQQERAFNNSQKSIQNLTKTHRRNSSEFTGGGRKKNKTRKLSIFQRLHSYF